ncbi:putative lantibiotic dehydratase [Actinacidiphila reveromycinica]|uniref:Putative lantibiotic dehydratase n=1 Tax=Actinacidiphila reveromycinica TaxID=659352 RepID=A0A7U3VMR4_9ACTN|nr:lantibiotic dehydratase [Streptomyces sp. SN-593]BBA96890.1 putative lantibiotic dehydratase [Streptomyces sp. SN-593]
MTRPSFQASVTALVRAVARPAVAQLPWPDFDDRSFKAEELTDVTTGRLTWIGSVWRSPNIVQALRHASPVLAHETEALIRAAAPSPRDVRRVGLSVARYLLRTLRPTPFGLFAGVASAAFGTDPRARWGEDHAVVARAGAEWLAKLIEQLERSGELLPLLSVVSNNTAFERDGSLVVPYQDDGPAGRRRVVEASVDLSPPVRSVLRAAGAPVRVGQLAEKLAAEFPAVAPERVHGLLAGLVRRRVLITNLHAPATETDALRHLIAQLDAVGAGSIPLLADTVRELRAVHAGLEQGGTAETRDDVAARMREVVPGLRRHPLALDLRLQADVVLPDVVAREVERAAAVLTRVCARPYGTEAWTEYHRRFYERFGIGTMVPLLEVVADSGVGYPDGYPGAAAGARRRRLSPRDDVLVRLAQAAALDGRDEVVLTDEILAALERGPQEPRVPAHLEVGVRLHAASLGEARRGQFTVEVTSVSRGAGVSTGRFLNVLEPDQRELLQGELADLPTADVGTVAAQLSFPPLLPDTAHVTRTPRVLPLVVSLQEHRAPDSAVLTPSDLAVACDGRRMYLAAPGLGVRIEATGMHALNLAEHTPPLARLITEVARAQSAQVTVFDWGAAAAMPFLPRLRHGRIVLAPARWRLEADDFPDRRRPGGEWSAALTGWWERRRLPQHVHLVEDDRRLPLDLDQAGHRSLLRQHLDRTRTAVLAEAGSPEANGWSGGRAHEIVVPLKAVQPPAWPALPTPTTARTLSPAQLQPPATSPLLLAALYGDPRRQDSILSRHVPDLMRRLGSPQWWFIRFRDPAQHLRLRITLHDPDGFADTARTVSAWADELRSAGLLSDLRYPTSYREMGRWGSGPAWNAAEAVFNADSRALVAQLGQPVRPGQRSLAAAHFFAIASAFLGSPNAGARWLIDHIPATAPEQVPRPQFKESVTLADPSGDWAALRSSPGGTTIVDAWAERTAALAAYRPHLLGPHTEGIDVDDVLTSLLHTHFVRHVAVNFPEEELCLYLARAAALAFTARARRRP